LRLDKNDRIRALLSAHATCLSSPHRVVSFCRLASIGTAAAGHSNLPATSLPGDLSPLFAARAQVFGRHRPQARRGAGRRLILGAWERGAHSLAAGTHRAVGALRRREATIEGSVDPPAFFLIILLHVACSSSCQMQKLQVLDDRFRDYQV
jgi:hypothetical protein